MTHAPIFIFLTILVFLQSTLCQKNFKIKPPLSSNSIGLQFQNNADSIDMKRNIRIRCLLNPGPCSKALTWKVLNSQMKNERTFKTNFQNKRSIIQGNRIFSKTWSLNKKKSAVNIHRKPEVDVISVRNKREACMTGSLFAHCTEQVDNKSGKLVEDHNQNDPKSTNDDTEEVTENRNAVGG